MTGAVVDGTIAEIPFLRRMLGSPSAALGGGVVVAILLMALLAPLVAPYDPNLQDTANRLMPPTPLAATSFQG